MKTIVHAFHGFFQGLGIGDVRLDQFYLAVGAGPFQMLRLAADQIVIGNDLRPFLNQLIGNVGADKTRTTGDQNTFALQIHYHSSFNHPLGRC